MGGVCHVGVGGSYRGGVGHAGVRWVIQGVGWVGDTGMGWGGSCRGRVGWAMQGGGVGWVMQEWGGSYRGGWVM